MQISTILLSESVLDVRVIMAAKSDPSSPLTPEGKLHAAVDEVIPVSLTGKYQLIILGHEGDARVAECTGRLNAALTLAFNLLGVNPRKFLVQIQSGSSRPALDRRMPSVAVFFGLVESPTLASLDADRLATLLSDGILIIPVVDDINRFSALVPTEIAHLNGISIADCGADLERLAARILEVFGLLRETRRLFISYRRKDTSGVAAQLYEALDAVGFDVFLDTHGVLRPGEPFQDILWHRLADTDVAVLLDSPDFMSSRWTEEELARANTSNIQILQVLWPGQEENAPAAFSTFYPLGRDDFDSEETLGYAARLREQSVGAIIDAIEGLRARAIAARHAFLVRQFFLDVREAGLSVRTTLSRTLIVSGDGIEETLVQVAVGVPDAERYEVLDIFHRTEASSGRKYSVPTVLLYDQTGIRGRWLDHLTWLNQNLTSVRSVSLVDAKEWLHSLARSTTTVGRSTT